MKLLVLAQIPPPLHGQSTMVRALLEGLRGSEDIEVLHSDLRLSDSHLDIGRWSCRKITRTFAAAFRTIALQVRHRCDALYYVPAPPGKRGALYRDWLILILCRRLFPHLILHWQGPGLAAWLDLKAMGIERALSRLALGSASLGVVLAEALRADAEYFRAKRNVVVPNGIPDPGPPSGTRHCTRKQILFIGLCSEEKGLFSAADAVLAANRATGTEKFHLVAAGPFGDLATESRFRALALAHGGVIRHAGFVEGAAKNELFRTSRALLFPSRYPAEGAPLVVLEALAHDLPVVTTRWRALPEIVTPECGRLVPSNEPEAIAAALLDLDENPPPAGACRARFLANYTIERHLESLKSAMLSLAAPRESGNSMPR